jgi:hypothetical protein
MCLCSTISNVATASRQMFAFARDRGMPCSDFLCRWVSVQLDSIITHHIGRQILTLQSLQGPPQLGHPPQRRLRLLRRNLPPLAHQPRQQRSLQRHRLANSRRDPQLLYRFDILRSIAANPAATASTRSLESRSRRASLQHHRGVVLAAGLRLCFLPAGGACGGGDHELELSDLWRGGAFFDLLLFFVWEACL